MDPLKTAEGTGGAPTCSGRRYFFSVAEIFEISRILLCCTLIYMFRAGGEFF
jgi:hypothetical protein